MGLSWEHTVSLCDRQQRGRLVPHNPEPTECDGTFSGVGKGHHLVTVSAREAVVPLKPDVAAWWGSFLLMAPPCFREFVASRIQHQNSLTSQNEMTNISEYLGFHGLIRIRKGYRHYKVVQQKASYI